MEMRDLLTDNMSLLQQLETFNSNCQLPGLPGALRPPLREVTSLGSWVYCFLAYIAIRADDPGTRHMLAYARLVVREAQRHGGGGGGGGASWTMTECSASRQPSTQPCRGTASTQKSRQQHFGGQRQAQRNYAHSAESLIMLPETAP